VPAGIAGFAYSAFADARGWAAMKVLLGEVFGEAR
jgi:hypothetical protein